MKHKQTMTPTSKITISQATSSLFLSEMIAILERLQRTTPEIINLFHTRLSMKILLTNINMPTIVSILIFMSRVNTISESLIERNIFIFSSLILMSS